jgi:hypothetical protein
MISADGNLLVATAGRLSVVLSCAMKWRLVLGGMVTAGRGATGIGLHVEAGLGLWYLTLHVVWGSADS